MDISTEFPDFDDYNGWWSLFFKLKEHGFKDECWHNETCPQVCKNIPTAEHPERFVRVWLDWKDQEKSMIQNINATSCKLAMNMVTGCFWTSCSIMRMMRFDTQNRLRPYLVNKKLVARQQSGYTNLSQSFERKENGKIY